MARLLTAGAETADKTAEGITTMPSSIVTSGQRSGSRCWSVATGQQNIADFSGVLSRSYLLRAYVYVSGFPSATMAMMKLLSTNETVSIRITSAGALQLWRDTTAQIGSDGPVIPTNQWCRLELRYLVGAGAGDDEAEARLDGTTFASVTGATYDTNAVASSRFGDLTGVTVPATYLFDDIALNDDQGASQSSWPGSGKEVLLLPTSDNSAGSWKAGSAASATANGALFNAVDNTPPVGTASPDAATAAISNTISGATSPNYDANMTTYSAAGIAAGDTVNLVQQIIAHGEDIATGTKTGTFAMVSNPAIAASASFNFGADVGAAGTYPTNWTVARGAVTYAPSVTLGTAPVARITKTDTGTRAADCCFLGVYVDYTPAPPVIPDLVMAPHRAP